MRSRLRFGARRSGDRGWIPGTAQAGRTLAWLALALAASASPALAGPDNAWEVVPAAPSRGATGAHGGLRVQDVPDIYGPGKVSTVCNVWMKVTNIGVLGNGPFAALSSDPSGQWPGPSGIEYLFFSGLWVGAKDATVTDPAILRRVSQTTEWRPPSLDPKDHIYQTFDGQVGGSRYSDDDSDGRVDEDPLDGNDDDGDGRVDEDYGAISQLEYTCLLRDDTPQAIEQPALEKHVPRGLQVRQSAYAFSVPGANDFVSVEWEVQNVTDHVLDSVYVGFRVDLDAGPALRDRYYADDLPEPRAPQGPDPTIGGDPGDPDNPNAPYLEPVRSDDPRYQGGLCQSDTIYVNGFSLADDDGDAGATPGAASFLLLGHTIDPTGTKAPRRVGFHMFRQFPPGVPFQQGGVPTNDIQRFEAMATPLNVDPQTGFIIAEPPDRGDINDWSFVAAVGPFLDMQPGEKVQVAWALAVQQIDYTARPDEVRKRFRKSIQNAVEAQKTYRGSYEARQGIPVPGATDFGRETCLIAKPGQSYVFSDCHDDSLNANRQVRDDECTWFDLDCNYCTGVPGMVLKRWSASSPPPNPLMTALPGDRRITLRWDNRSEYTPDPTKGAFDFAGYKIWKAANWSRPVGSTGPGDDLWALLGTYYYYDPVLNPLRLKTPDGRDSVVAVPLLLNRGTGEILFPHDVPCVESAPGVCDTAYAMKNTFAPSGRDSVIERYPVVRYPIGRYEFVDRNVLNGFLYFYSVTAFDSTGRGRQIAMLDGRQAAVEADGVVPQSSFAAASNGGKPYVVPNPYRGRAEWDLSPSPADPTGTHVDFFNLPPAWLRLRIFTLSGDLVQEILPGDLQVNGRPQREVAGDDQASWNLVTRNGQDVVSGIYLFSVETPGGHVNQGKFTVIR